MSRRNKKRASQARHTQPITTNHAPGTGAGAAHFQEKPPTVAEEELLKEHNFQFEVQSLTERSSDLFECDLGNTSFTGNSIVALKCSNQKVDNCFKRAKTDGSSVFAPISAYKHGEKCLLVGEDVGEKLEDWVLSNRMKLWSKSTAGDGTGKGVGDFTEVVVNLGRQLVEIVTKNHQNDKFIGNIKEGLCVTADSKIVFIPSYKPAMEISGLANGIKKDIGDLRWFLQTVFSPYQALETIPTSYTSFYRLIPQGLEDIKNVAKLKKLSFLICHTPLFWGTHERWLFSNIAFQLYQKQGKIRAGYFYKFFPIDRGLNDVGEWWEVVTALASQTPEPLLLKVYKYGIKRSSFYQDKQGIVPFIRSVFEHFQQHDASLTLEQVDNLILGEFKSVYEKLYLAMSSTQAENCVLEEYLKEGAWALNYNK